MTVFIVGNCSVPVLALSNGWQNGTSQTTYATKNSYVAQGMYTNYCWAASTCSMLQAKGYYIGVTDFVYSICNGQLNNQSVGTNDLVTSLATNVQFSKYKTTSYRGSMTLNNIKSNITDGRPIYASIQLPLTAHAVAISGYNPDTSGTLGVMDPDRGWQYTFYNTFKSTYLGYSNTVWQDGFYFN